MDFLEFLFPDLKPGQRRVKINHLETQAAVVLVATDYDMRDADIISNVAHYHSRWPGTQVNGQLICDLRSLLRSIMTSSSPAQSALEYYCKENGFTVTFDKVLVDPTSPFYKGKDHCSFAQFQDIIESSAHNGQNIFTVLKHAKMVFNKDERTSALNLYIEHAKQEYTKSIGEKIK